MDRKEIGAAAGTRTRAIAVAGQCHTARPRPHVREDRCSSEISHVRLCLMVIKRLFIVAVRHSGIIDMKLELEIRLKRWFVVKWIKMANCSMA